MVTLENNKNENFKCQNFNGKCFIFDPLPRDQKPFFKILPDVRHMSDQLYHIWKSPLGDPIVILPSILYGDPPVKCGIPLTNAIRKKAIFHTSFSSRSSFFQSMCMMYCVNRKCYYLSKLSCFLHKFIGFIKIMRFPAILTHSRPYTFINMSLLK